MQIKSIYAESYQIEMNLSVFHWENYSCYSSWLYFEHAQFFEETQVWI